MIQRFLRGLSPVLAAVLPAVALALPPLPRVDYSAVLRIDGLAQPVRVAHHAGVLRSEGTVGGRRVVGLLELASGRVTLMPAGAQGPALRVPEGTEIPGLANFDPRTLALGAATGRARVAGHDCTLRRVSEGGRDVGTACVHAADIVLSFDGSVRGRRVRMETVALTLAAQPAADFAAPPASIADFLERLPAIPGLTAPRHPQP